MLFLCSGLSTYPRFRVSPWNFQLNPNFSVGTKGQGRRGHHDDREETSQTTNKGASCIDVKGRFLQQSPPEKCLLACVIVQYNLKIEIRSTSMTANRALWDHMHTIRTTTKPTETPANFVRDRARLPRAYVQQLFYFGPVNPFDILCFVLFLFLVTNNIGVLRSVIRQSNDAEPTIQVYANRQFKSIVTQRLLQLTRPIEFFHVSLGTYIGPCFFFLFHFWIGESQDTTSLPPLSLASTQTEACALQSWRENTIHSFFDV